MSETAEDADSENTADLASETEDETPDVLLTEAGNVLVDALVLKQQRFAVHAGKKE